MSQRQLFTDDIIQEVANLFHTTPEIVRREMNATIEQAFANPNKGPEVITAQEATPCQGNR